MSPYGIACFGTRSATVDARPDGPHSTPRAASITHCNTTLPSELAQISGPSHFREWLKVDQRELPMPACRVTADSRTEPLTSAYNPERTPELGASDFQVDYHSSLLKGPSVDGPCATT
jgi:hypothetical protein